MLTMFSTFDGFQLVGALAAKRRAEPQLFQGKGGVRWNLQEKNEQKSTR